MSTPGPIKGSIPAPRPANVVSPPAAPAAASLRFRGAVVEDLQLPPAVCVGTRTSVAAALRIAHDHDYSQLPVMAGRAPRGYLDVRAVQAAVAQGSVQDSAPVEQAMTRFGGGAQGAGFVVITPETGLAELEAFLAEQPFAFVTDASRSFVMCVATSEDLSRYISRRGLGPSAAAPMDVDGNTTPTHAGGASGSNADATETRQPLSRREEEEKRKDRTLGEFLGMLDGYDPLIPDEVTEYYLAKVGFECDDQRVKRLLSLAAEKFVSDIATDAFQYARIRTNAGPGRQRGGAAGGGGAAGAAKERARTVLTMDDLSAALGEYGINAKRAEFYR